MSAAKKQIKTTTSTTSTTSVIKSRKTNNLMKIPLSGVKPQPPIVQKNTKSNLNSTNEESLESLSGVTLNVTPDNQTAVKANSKLTNQRATTITELTKPTNMTSNAGIANESENNMLSAIARLETKLVESCKNDIIEMEKKLTTNMKVIVDNSIQEAFKNITSTVTAIVSVDPEILRQKRNISQLQNEN